MECMQCQRLHLRLGFPTSVKEAARHSAALPEALLPCSNCTVTCAHAEYLRVTRMMLPRLNEITTPWICFHGEGNDPLITWPARRMLVPPCDTSC